MTKKPALNEPIVLSGRVYLAGFLAQEVSGFDLPATLRAGDIKLHNVPKAGKRQRYGQSVEFSGFFAASIWNGKRFCRLLMRKKAAMDATYMGIVELRSKARTCVIDLRRLSALQAVWVAADHGYEVTYNASSHPLSHTTPPANLQTAAKPVAAKSAAEDPAAEKSAAETVAAKEVVPAAVTTTKVDVTVSVAVSVVVEQGKPETADSGSTKAAPTKTTVSVTSPVVPGQQLALFPDMPVSTGGKKRRRKR
jgi:hypothetical protein